MAGLKEGVVTLRGREKDGRVIIEVIDTGNGPPWPFEEGSSPIYRGSERSEGLGL